MDNRRAHILFVNSISYWDFWEKNTGLEERLAWPSRAFFYLLVPLNTSMAVMLARNGDDTALPEFLLFPLVLVHTSSVLYPLIFQTARSAEVQEGCNTLQLCDWCPMGATGSTGWPHRERLSHHQSLPQALCQLPSQFHHIQSYYVFSPSPVFPLQVTFKNISVWSWNTLRKASVHVILSDQRQRKSGFSTIHQIPFGPENFTVVLCQATMPAFSKMSEDNLNRNCILRILLNNAFLNLLRSSINLRNITASHESFPVNKNPINLFSS